MEPLAPLGPTERVRDGCRNGQMLGTDRLQVGLVRCDAIYDALSQLPVTLV